VSKYGFIREQVGRYELAELCESLEVSRSGYHRWKCGQPSARRGQDEVLMKRIGQIHRQAGERCYGHRPVYMHLLEEGFACGRDRTLRLMNELGLCGHQLKSFKPMATNSEHLFGYRPNLLRELGSPEACNEVWVADTTYLLTESGWWYLATVMDLCSRRIVGWSLSQSNDTALVCTALKAAVMTRGEIPEGLVHHSDRGSTYASDRYQRLLGSLGMNSSMSGKGNCYDNAAMESFFGRFKTSSVRDHIFADENELRAKVFDYIEVFYNRFRKHASLGYRNPVQAEEKLLPPMGGRQHPCCPSRN